jgi:hypothetical protein
VPWWFEVNLGALVVRNKSLGALVVRNKSLGALVVRNKSLGALVVRPNETRVYFRSAHFTFKYVKTYIG